ncbi:hypothetical protein PENTCL1PPCAC_3089, partial [Pristionchus entomophagus]
SLQLDENISPGGTHTLSVRHTKQMKQHLQRRHYVGQPSRESDANITRRSNSGKTHAQSMQQYEQMKQQLQRRIKADPLFLGGIAPEVDTSEIWYTSE